MSARSLQRHEGRWFDVAAAFGFQPSRPVPVGFEATFTFGHSAAENRLYTFADRRGRRLSLCGDSLAATLRLFSGLHIAEARLSFACPVLRYARGPARYWTQVGVTEVAPRPVSLRSVVRLAAVGAKFLADVYPTKLVVNDVGVWRALLGSDVLGAEPDTVLFALSKVPTGSWPAVLRAHGMSSRRVKWVDEFLREADGSPGLCDRISACPVDAVGVRLRALDWLANELGRVTGVLPQINVADLHGSEFSDGVMFQWRDIDSGRTVGDGGDFSRYASRFLGVPIGVASSVIGLEMVNRRAMLDGADGAPCIVVGADSARSADTAVALVDRLRASSCDVWDVEGSTSLRRLLKLAKRQSLPLIAHVRRSEDEPPLVRVGSSTEIALLPSEDAFSWLMERIQRLGDSADL